MSNHIILTKRVLSLIRMAENNKETVSSYDLDVPYVDLNAQIKVS